MATIRLSGEQLVEYGGEIKTLAEALGALVDDISKLVNDINDAWDGLAADSYIAAYEGTKETLAQLEPVVQGLSDSITRIGQTWIETEQGLAANNA